MENMVDTVSSNGGVVRVRMLRDAGYSRRAIDRALRTGALLRIRHGWVARPAADEQLIKAAQAGVVLTCVTQARRLGLWVLDDAVVHVAAPAHAGHVRAGNAKVHRWCPGIPMLCRTPSRTCSP